MRPVLKTLTFMRRNAIALTALFVALGGASYAALAIPRNSVGTPQLRSGAVTPPKLDGKLIGGTIRAWAYVSASGHEYSGSGIHGVHAEKPLVGAYGMLLNDQHVDGCAATASVVVDQHRGTPSGPGSALASVLVRKRPFGVGVNTYGAAGGAASLPFLVEVLC
jgi:hypothetical protein